MSESPESPDNTFQIMFEGACVGMAQIVMPSRKLRRVNQALCRITGFTRDELLTMTVDQLNHPEDRELDQSIAKRHAWGKIPQFQVEKRYLRKDGQVVWVLASGSFIHDSQGNPQYGWAVIQDITERKLSQLALQESHQRLQMALTASEAGTWSWDCGANTSDWDDRFRQLYGFAPETPPTFETWVSRLIPEDRSRIMALLQNVLENPENNEWDVEFRATHPDGRLHWIQALGRAERDAAGHVTRLTGINLEISRRKRVEEEVRRLNETLEQRVADRTREVRLLGQAVASMSDGVLITECHADWFECRIVFVNEALCRMTGYAERDLVGHPVRVLQGDPVNTAAIDRVKSERERGQSCSVELINRRKDGSTCEVEMSISPLTDPAGVPLNLVSIHHEIGRRKRAEALIHEQAARLQAILNTVSNAVITIDESGIMVNVNPAAVQMFGYTIEELLGANVTLLMPAPFRQEHDGHLRRYRETGIPRIIGRGSRELLGMRKGGETFPIELTVSQVDHLRLFTGVIADITERRRLQNQVLETAAAEQRRIGQELHDGICQELVGMELIASSAVNLLQRLPVLEEGPTPRRSVDAESYDRLLATCSNLCQLLSQANGHVRQLARGIMPVQIDRHGLRSALEDLATTLNVAGSIECAFDCPEPVEIENNTTATHLYRIAQEAVSNAVRHGQATRIRIVLEQSRDQIRLIISDNGRGIDEQIARRVGPLPPGKTGLGLRTMNYRAQSIGGTLTVEPGPDGGTTVTCLVFGGRSVD